ncbi:hypothetical protein [Pseudobutyrivibrio sp.]
MKSYLTFALLLIPAIVFLSCNKKGIERDLRKLLGTEVVIPYAELISKDKSEVTPTTDEFTYVVYYDSLTCSTCTLKNMYFWEVLNDSISKLGKSVRLIFIFSPPGDEKMQFLNDLSHSRMGLTTLVDTTGCFIRANKHIPSNPNAHAFLLDKNDKVIMVGNAYSNPSIEQLLFKTISNDKQK